MKFCKDCKHVKKEEEKYQSEDGKFITRFVVTEWAQCLMAPRGIDPVTGKDLGHYFCETLRILGGKCGPQGKYWESK